MKLSNLMRKNLILSLLLLMGGLCVIPSDARSKQELWPDGTPMDAWFSDTAKINVDQLGKKYVLTDYGVKNDSNIIQTEAVQHVIDLVARNGGGVVVVRCAREVETDERDDGSGQDRREEAVDPTSHRPCAPRRR